MPEKRLREFEELVLLAVLVAGSDAYGATIQEVLEAEAGRAASLGAIYTALDRLARKRLVDSELGEPTPVQGGRRKRYYRLTASGLEQVAAIRRIRERLWAKADPSALEEGIAP